jgi:histidine kinase-, DNA gyrase B-, and HSP90-like ATPase
VKCWAALQDATELVVTLPLLLALVHWIAPSVRALSHSSLKLQLQFGVIPLLSYVFDYFTRIYTDLLSSGNQAAVEFMPFVCSLVYLVFVLQTPPTSAAWKRPTATAGWSIPAA